MKRGLNLEKHTLKPDPRLFVRNGVGASRVFCQPGQWQTLLAFLCEQFPAVSAQVWRDRFEQGAVLDETANPLAIDSPFLAGKTVHYFREVAHETPLPYAERVVYQDDYLVVADKPHFLPVVPSGRYVQETLLVRLKKSLDLPELSPIHRIDRDTAGLVVFCIYAKHRGHYQALFRKGLVQKTYQAIAPLVNLPTALPYVIQNCLQDAPNFMQMQLMPSAPVNTLTHITAVKCIQSAQVAYPQLARYTLEPHTGKRHQLRVHMLSIGAPIVGDQIYPELMAERDISVPGHLPLQLLAKHIRFCDPLTGHIREFESERMLSLDSSDLHV